MGLGFMVQVSHKIEAIKLIDSNFNVAFCQLSFSIFCFRVCGASASTGIASLPSLYFGLCVRIISQFQSGDLLFSDFRINCLLNFSL